MVGSQIVSSALITKEKRGRTESLVYGEGGLVRGDDDVDHKVVSWD